MDSCAVELYGAVVLNVQRLAVLRAVVTTGSVTAAAAQLSYTPSAVSQHVAALERETGLTLLERAGRRVRPTAAGSLLAAHAEQILAVIADAERALAALAEGRTGRLRFASFASGATALVPAALGRFRARHPEVDVQLTLGERPAVLAALAAGQVDLALVIADVADGARAAASARPGRGLDWRPVLADPYFVVAPCSHPLAALAEVPLRRLDGQPIVSGNRAPDCPDGAAFVQACAAAGFRPSTAVEVDDYPTAVSLVAAGLGVAPVPYLGLFPALPHGVAARPLVQPALTRHIHAVCRAGNADPTVDRMLDELRAVADHLVAGAPERLPA